jgi:glycosyltransferase involved in cell wall biosynthesis
MTHSVSHGPTAGGRTPAARPADRPLKVVVLVGTPPTWTGTDEVTLGLVATLVRRGHDVTVLQYWTDTFAKRLQEAGVECRTVHMPIGWELSRVGRAEWLRVMKSLRGDVCLWSKHVWFNRQRWIDLGAKLYFRRYVAIEHVIADPWRPTPQPRRLGGLLPGIDGQWCREAVGYALHFAAFDTVVTVSAAVRDRLTEHYQLPRRKARVVHNGVDVGAFRFDAAGRDELRSAWGIPDGDFVFGAVGRLSRQKGYDQLLPVMARLAAAPERDAWLVLAGDGEDAEQLAQTARDLGVADRVVFPGWLAGVERRAAALSAYDCFLLPSRWEGLPLGLLEAMACERPSIATDVGGVREAFSDPTLGWLVPSGDEQALESAMRTVMAMGAESRRTMGLRARRYVVEHLDGAQQYALLADAVLGL